MYKQDQSGSKVFLFFFLVFSKHQKSCSQEDDHNARGAIEKGMPVRFGRLLTSPSQCFWSFTLRCYKFTVETTTQQSQLFKKSINKSGFFQHWYLNHSQSIKLVPHDFGFCSVRTSGDLSLVAYRSLDTASSPKGCHSLSFPPHHHTVSRFFCY